LVSLYSTIKMMHGPINIRFIDIFVDNQLDARFFFMYVYFYSLHVSDSYVSIIRRINCINTTYGICHHHHHKHQVLDALIRSASRVTAACANASSVFQLFSFLVVCGGMISKGFGFVAFFASVKASSVCIHLSCLVCQ